MMVGDGLNDLDALEVVGHSVAMGNAHSDLLDYCDYVVAPVGQDGLVEALSFLGVFEINRQNLPSGAQLASPLNRIFHWKSSCNGLNKTIDYHAGCLLFSEASTR